MDNVKEIRYTSLDKLAPIVEVLAERALGEANDLGYSVKPFETYRSPSRQTALYAQGRSAPGNIITRARAWQSFHQYGLALDVVFFINGRWCWDSNLPWDKIVPVFEQYNFTRLDFEKPHFELTANLTWLQAYNIVNRSGMPALHEYVEKYYTCL